MQAFAAVGFVGSDNELIISNKQNCVLGPFDHGEKKSEIKMTQYGKVVSQIDAIILNGK